jgi:uncharacterized glyoxalase superfamily protein PhnB
VARPDSYDPNAGFPRILPWLRYADVAAASEWLADVFGLSERLRWIDGDGVVRLAELRLGDALVQISQASDAEPTPDTLGRSGHVLVAFVDDVDAHHAHARERGARIMAEPEDKPWGLRQYMAADLDGHRWEFSQFLRDVPPAEWGATVTGG